MHYSGDFTAATAERTGDADLSEYALLEPFYSFQEAPATLPANLKVEDPRTQRELGLTIRSDLHYRCAFTGKHELAYGAELFFYFYFLETF